jgi:hypothetical protein
MKAPQSFVFCDEYRQFSESSKGKDLYDAVADDSNVMPYVVREKG